MHVHLIGDALLGVFLAVSPWLFGFADEGTSAWLPHFVVGIAEVAVAALTSPRPARADEAQA